MRFPRQVDIKDLLLHLSLYILAVCLVFFVLNQYLLKYTRHGLSLSVPDVKGLTFEKARQALEAHKLKVEIYDSMYDGNKGPVILEQSPKAGTKVKPDRKIYLTINSGKVPVIAFPDLNQATLRQTETILANFDIKIDKISYTRDMALNAVQRVYYQGKPIKAGTTIPRGSGITLVLGDGGNDDPAIVPNLAGMTLDEAKILLGGNYLNLNDVNYDPDIKDARHARIYKQIPASEEKVSKGSFVTLFLKKNKQ